MSMLRYGNRLIWTADKPPDSRFWDEWWIGEDFDEKHSRAVRSTSLSPIEKPLLRWMPASGRLVEAGCGYGPYVYALRNRGYDVEGIDYGEGLVGRIRKLDPESPIRYGDVCHMSCPDGYYSGYISLGVMEHRYEGPEPFLQEAFRILMDGGVAFISIPYYDALWKIRLPRPPSRIPDPRQGEYFFQWHYTRREFATFIQNAGFEIVETGSYAVRYGALRSIPLFGKIVKMRGGYRLWKLLEPVEDLLSNVGWMQYHICPKYKLRKAVDFGCKTENEPLFRSVI